MNIELQGFLPGVGEILGEKLWSRMIAVLPSERLARCAVTIVECRSFDHHLMRVPFIRVYSPRLFDRFRVRKIIEPLRKDKPMSFVVRVEFVWLAGQWKP